jgi:hypothetical protein
MATIRFHREEGREGNLPLVCMVCGENAEEHEPLRKRFTWMPGWVYLFLLVHLLVFLIVALIVRKACVVYTPLCEEHRGYWSNRMWMNLGLLMSLVGIIASMVVLAQFSAPGWTYAVIAGSFLVMLISAAVVSQRSIRPTHIDERTIRLTNVNSRFCQELRDQRSRDEDDYYNERD